MNAVTPKRARERFVELLTRSKTSLAETLPSERKKDGPNKALATRLRISPSRLGEFLNVRFELPILGADGKLRAGSRRRLAGFSGSVHRAVKWLRETARGTDEELEELDLEKIVEGYWPALAHDQLPQARSGIVLGLATAASDGPQTDRNLQIDIWAVNWGPVTFLKSFGVAVASGIDPIDSHVAVETRKLRELLNDLPPPSHQARRYLGLGPSATAARQFRGFQFVTVPSLKIPIVGLQVFAASTPASHGGLRFQSIFDKKVLTKRAVISHEVGHMTMASILPDIKDDREKLHILPNDELANLPQLLVRETQTSKDGRVILLSDAMVAFDIFVQLRSIGVEVEVISQWDQTTSPLDFLDRPFVFSPGIMLREEQRDFAELLEESQRQIFKSDWRANDVLFTPLITDLEGWLKDRGVDRLIAGEWPDHAPVLLFAGDELEEYLRPVVTSPEARKRIVDRLAVQITNRCQRSLSSDALLKLLKLSPPLQKQNDQGLENAQ
jgi:hypothetical protein